MTCFHFPFYLWCVVSPVSLFLFIFLFLVLFLDSCKFSFKSLVFTTNRIHFFAKRHRAEFIRYFRMISTASRIFCIRLYIFYTYISNKKWETERNEMQCLCEKYSIRLIGWKIASILEWKLSEIESGNAYKIMAQRSIIDRSHRQPIVNWESLRGYSLLIFSIQIYM